MGQAFKKAGMEPRFISDFRAGALDAWNEIKDVVDRH
jgi:hypothetical protein